MSHAVNELDVVQPAVSTPTSSDPLALYYEQSQARVRQRIPKLAEELRSVGIVCVEVDYDGVGDSGQIDTVRYFDKSREVPFPASGVSMSEQAVKNLFYDLVEMRNPGWENDEGGFGSMRWDVVSGDLHHQHHMRYTEYETTEYSGL